MRLLPILAVSFIALLFAAPREALADCVLNGITVICSGPSSTGFTAGAGQNGLTVDVLGGATVGSTITLNNSNTVTNNGSISSTSAGFGIKANNDNNIVNNGTITLGASGVGVNVNGGGSVSNTGTITFGEDGTGILVDANNSTITNSGTINVGACGVGIDTSSGSGAKIVNSGRILASTSCAASGISMGTGDTLTNSGLIQASESGFALESSGNNNQVTNRGTIDGPISLAGSSNNNTLTNSGLITVSASFDSGIVHAVDGTFTQTASGVLGLRITTDNSSGYDSLQVTGTAAGTGAANLGGTLRAQVQPGLYGSSTTYVRVLTFVSSTGRFASVETGLTFLTASAVYNSDSIDLVLSRIPFNQLPGNGANGRAVGNVLEANYATSLTGPLANFYTQLLQSGAPNTLLQLTGEVATAAQTATFAGFGQFFRTILDQTSAVRATASTSQAGNGGRQAASLHSTKADGGARRAMIPEEPCLTDTCDAAAAAAPRVSAWMQGFGSAGSIDRNVAIGNSRVDVSVAGGATGVDVWLDPKTLIGFALGTTTSGSSLTDLQSYGTARAILLGVYGSYATGPAYLDAALGYGVGSFTTSRLVGTGSIGEQINGSFAGNQYGGSIEGGRRFAFGENVLTPYAGLTVQALQQNGYTETSRNVSTGGPGMLALAFQPQTSTSVRSTLGMQFMTAIHIDDDNVLRPWLKLGWAHEFNTNRSATATLSTVLPGAPFTVIGAEPPADALVVRAGFELDFGGMVRLYGQFDGDFASVARSYGGTGGLRLRW